MDSSFIDAPSLTVDKLKLKLPGVSERKTDEQKVLTAETPSPPHALEGVQKFIHHADQVAFDEKYQHSLLEDTANQIRELGRAAGKELQEFVTAVDGLAGEERVAAVQEILYLQKQGGRDLDLVLGAQAELELRCSQEAAEIPRARAEIEARERALERAMALWRETSDTLKQKIAQERSFKVAIETARQNTLAIKGALGADFRLLRDGDVEAGREMFHLGKMAKVIRILDADEKLKELMRSSLARRPAKRSWEESALVQSLELTMRKTLDKLISMLAEEATAYHELQSAHRRATIEEASAAKEAAGAKARLEGARLMLTFIEREHPRTREALEQCRLVCKAARRLFAGKKFTYEGLTRRPGRALMMGHHSMKASARALQKAVAELGFMAGRPRARAAETPPCVAPTLGHRALEVNKHQRRCTSAPPKLLTPPAELLMQKVVTDADFYGDVAHTISQEVTGLKSLSLKGKASKKSQASSATGSRAPKDAKMSLKQFMSEASAAAEEVEEAQEQLPSEPSRHGSERKGGVSSPLLSPPESPCSFVSFTSTRNLAIRNRRSRAASVTSRSASVMDARAASVMEQVPSPYDCRSEPFATPTPSVPSVLPAPVRVVLPLGGDGWRRPRPRPPRITPHMPASEPPSRGGWPLPGEELAQQPRAVRLASNTGAELSLPSLPLAGCPEVQSARGTAADREPTNAFCKQAWRLPWSTKLEDICEERTRLADWQPPAGAAAAPRPHIPELPRAPAHCVPRPFGRRADARQPELQLSPPVSSPPVSSPSRSREDAEHAPYSAHGLIWRRRFVAVAEPPPRRGFAAHAERSVCSAR